MADGGAGAGAAAATAASPGSVEEVDVLSGERNPRGIPGIKFLEDVAGFIRDNKTTVEAVVASVQTMYSKYKFMEGNLRDNRRRLKTQIPDLKASLEAIRHLQAKAAAAAGAADPEAGTFNAFYPLADNVYMNARVPPTDRVCLWLGADVMVEYTLEEARALLENNLKVAVEKLEQNSEDTEYLQNQIVTTEVTMSRVINYDVVARRKAKAAEGGAGAGAAAAASS